jgi:hypothetical protein
MRFNQAPTVLTKCDNRNLAVCQVLLISEILIGGQQEVEPSFFRDTQQIAVEKVAPSLLISRFDDVAGKELAKRDGVA